MARFNLPDINFVDIDPDEIETNIVNRFSDLSGINLSNADPRRKFIQSLVYGMTLVLNNIDYSGKQNLLAYAVDDFLDHFGAGKGVSRIEPKYAGTTLRFEINPIEDDVINAGTTIAINDILFATKEDTPVHAGDTQVDIYAECLTPGEIGNGFLPGQINELVNTPVWVNKAYNITSSSGGADWEDDDSYAEQIRQSNESYSTAGPEGAYEYYAKSANQLIIDVYINSPSPNVVEIRPLLQGGELPSTEILTEVSDACNDRTVRPLTDQVQVISPEEVVFDIDAVYYVAQENENILDSIKTSVSQAVDDYTLWQKSKLGRGIDTGELSFRIKEAGARRIVINSPQSYTAIEKYQVARAQNVTVNYGGIVDE